MSNTELTKELILSTAAVSSTRLRELLKVDNVKCHGCVNITGCKNCAACNDCLYCKYCSNCTFCTCCSWCSYCKGCIDCENCYLCNGLKNKMYYIRNIQFSREEYREVINSL